MEATLRFFECGCCGHFHLMTFWGDCRDDNNRFTYDEMEQKAMDETGDLPDIYWLDEQEEE